MEGHNGRKKLFLWSRIGDSVLVHVTALHCFVGQSSRLVKALSLRGVVQYINKAYIRSRCWPEAQLL